MNYLIKQQIKILFWDFWLNIKDYKYDAYSYDNLEEAIKKCDELNKSDKYETEEDVYE
jgi:hypothetical protein